MLPEAAPPYSSGRMTRFFALRRFRRRLLSFFFLKAFCATFTDFYFLQSPVTYFAFDQQDFASDRQPLGFIAFYSFP